MSEALFSIVVADDEPELLEAVCSLVDWESAGFTLAGRAGNGLDALQLVEQLQPDLLLTDIQMPFITGTELARQVRELQPLIQVAFLTGYDDFAYAKSAIDSQVISYLLKPISIEELTDALRVIHAKMQRRFRELSPAQDEGTSLPLALACLLLDSYEGSFTEEELRSSLENCGLPLSGAGTFAVLAVCLGGEGILPQSAAQTVDKCLRDTCRSGSFVSGRRIFTLAASEDGFANLNGALDELFYVIRRMLGQNCTIGVSVPFTELSRAAAACREAVDCARMADGPGIVQMGEMESRAGSRMQGEKRQAEAFDRLLFGENKEALEKYLIALLGPQASEMQALQVLVTAQGVLRAALGEEALAELLQRSGLTDPLSAGLDRESLCRRVNDLCLTGFDRITDRKKTGISALVDQALWIIRRRYMDETLSLLSVSEELHVSPNYLSANMKKYAGDTFLNLLIRQRMEAAYTYLQAGGMKIGEIAQKCGYSDQHYFSFCFKKYYGVSPARMRRS